jgi:hypothetical protein
MQKSPVPSTLTVILIIFVIIADIFILKDLRNQEQALEETANILSSGETCSCSKEIESLRENTAPIKENTRILKKTGKPVSLKINQTNKAECELPVISTHVKFFTDYRYYNLRYTPHYRLQQAAWTDSQGLRRYNDDYIVALASYYTTKIGDRFEVTLDTGKVFTVIFGDGKVDADCDSKKMYTPCVDYDGNDAANLLEFIIDEKMLSSEVYNYGSIDCLDEFKGNVEKMVYLGRDNSQDWDTYENN